MEESRQTLEKLYLYRKNNVQLGQLVSSLTWQFVDENLNSILFSYELLEGFFLWRGMRAD